MKFSGKSVRRPDPFGVLVMVVAFALSLTLVAQAEAAQRQAPHPLAISASHCAGLPRLVDTRLTDRRARRARRADCRERLSPKRMLGLWAALAVR